MINSTSSLADVFELFLTRPIMDSTRNKYRVFFKPFLAKYGRKPLAEIDKALVHDWFEYLESLGYARGYLSFHRNCFHAFFNWCVKSREEGGVAILENNPAHKLKNYPQTAVILEVADAADVERCLQACEAMWDTLKNQRDAAIFALASVGLRASNVRGVTFSEMKRCLARPQNVKGLGNMYVLPTTGKRPMDAVFDERRAGIIRRYVKNRPKCSHNWLFISCNKGKGKLGKSAYNWSRANVCRVAGVPLITFQQMRRMVGTNIAKNKGALTAAHALGHVSGVQTIINHYYNPDLEAARMAVFESLFTGKNAQNGL